jgi:hypothetical protein
VSTVLHVATQQGKVNKVRKVLFFKRNPPTPRKVTLDPAAAAPGRQQKID